MTYKFERHDGAKLGRIKEGKFIKIGFHTGYLSREFMREMRIPEDRRVFVEIFTDKENRAFAIEVLSKPSDYSYTSKNGYLSTRGIAKDMPPGKYIFKEEQDGRYIFVIE